MRFRRRSLISSTHYTLRSDGRYTVVVGWDGDLQTFFAHVRDDGETLLAVGDRAREVPTLSALVAAVGRFADLDTTIISRLRRDATPLGSILS